MSHSKSTLDQCQTVCHAIHGGEEPFGITFMKRDPKTLAVINVIDYFGTFSKHRPMLEKCIKDKYEAYLMVASTNAKGHSKSVVTHSFAVAADFDSGFPDALEDNDFIRPSITIETSTGRYHAIWIFDSQCSPTQMACMADVIHLRYGGDPAFSKTNQMIRLPGFINRKNGHTVRQYGALGKPTHSFDTLYQAFDATLVINQQRMKNHRYDENLIIPRNDNNSEVEMLEDAKDAISYLSAQADTYHSWVHIGRCLTVLGNSGLKLFHDFSMKSPKYNTSEVDKKWDSLRKTEDNSLKPLFYLAQKSGWKNPGYRKQDTGNVNSMTDRSFGVLCAQAMREEYAVIEYSKEKSIPQFFKLEDGCYRALNDIERRREVELISTAVISKICESGSDTSFKNTWRKKIGTNKGLDDVSEHIAEVLIRSSAENKVRSFPYFPVAKGVVNLLSRQVVPSSLKPLPLYSTSVEYDTAAKAPLFTKVVNDIFEHDKAVVRFMFQLFGLILLGRPEQYFFVWLGQTANNGKSLLVKTLKSVLGQYFTFLPTAALMLKSHTSDGANPSIAQLAGKRLAVLSEPTAKQTLDASLIKQLTGDGHINVRENYGAPKDVRVEAVILMVANYMPAAHDDDNGLWRRAMIIPFNKTFSAEEDDKDLPDKLAKETSGIFNMMLDGAHDYLKHGLIVPEKIKHFVAQQRHDVDPFSAFAVDCLVLSKNETCSLKDIHACYIEWAKQNPRLRRLTKPEISKRLEKLYKKRVSGNLPMFDGVAVVK